MNFVVGKPRQWIPEHIHIWRYSIVRLWSGLELPRKTWNVAESYRKVTEKSAKFSEPQKLTITLSVGLQFTMPTGYVAECRTVKCLGIKCTGNHAASRLIQCQTLGKTDVSVGLSVALLHGLSGVDIPTATLRRSVPHLYYGADDISCNLDDGRNFWIELNSKVHIGNIPVQLGVGNSAQIESN